MATEGRDGATVRFPPPLVYLGAVIAGGLLQLVLPWTLPLGRGLRIGAAFAIGALGVALMAGAIRLFRRTGQDPAPWAPTPEIVSSGVYRFTRNPMYVGMTLLQIAIGVGFANLWILALVPPAVAVIQAIAIRHEEAYLERKFGATYLDYKRSVRRWI